MTGLGRWLPLSWPVAVSAFLGTGPESCQSGIGQSQSLVANQMNVCFGAKASSR